MHPAYLECPECGTLFKARRQLCPECNYRPKNAPEPYIPSIPPPSRWQIFRTEDTEWKPK